MNSHVKCLSLALGLLICTSLLTSTFTKANSGSPVSIINLKTCEIDIRADRIDNHQNSIDYYGNVQFLYGLANVRANKVTLIKNKDGSCKLVSNSWNSKNSNH